MRSALACVLVALVTLALLSQAHGARMRTVVRRANQPVASTSVSASAPASPSSAAAAPASSSKPASSASTAGSASQQQAPAVSSVGASGSTAPASTPATASSLSADKVSAIVDSLTSAATAAGAGTQASASVQKGAGPSKRHRKNKVTVISNLNVMQHTEAGPSRPDLVGMSEQHSKSMQEARQKQTALETKLSADENARKADARENEQDTKADVAKAQADAAAANAAAAQEAQKKKDDAARKEQEAKQAVAQKKEADVKASQQKQEGDIKKKAKADSDAAQKAEQDQKASAQQAAQKSEQDTKKAEQNKKAADAKAAADEQKTKEAERKKQLDEQNKKKADEEAAKLPSVILAGPLRPVKSNNIAPASKIQNAAAYTYMFWIKFLTVVDGWTNILHKGEADDQRNPSVYVYPGTSRLHIRSGTKDNFDNGLDPEDDLPLNVWHHVAFIHQADGITVYINNGKIGTVSASGPVPNNGPLYACSPWYDPPNAVISDVRYFNKAVPVTDLASVFGLAKHPQ